MFPQAPENNIRAILNFSSHGAPEFREWRREDSAKKDQR
jgi:hypothetical protein